jgi:type I restriction enzyme M protein
LQSEKSRTATLKIDSLKWLKDESLGDTDELQEPEELAIDGISELESAVDELNAIVALLENNNSLETLESSKREK